MILRFEGKADDEQRVSGRDVAAEVEAAAWNGPIAFTITYSDGHVDAGTLVWIDEAAPGGTMRLLVADGNWGYTPLSSILPTSRWYNGAADERTVVAVFSDE